jgi:hypothetical protein
MRSLEEKLRVNSQANRGLRLLLTLMMWQAPLPWCHAHPLADEAVQSNAWLVAHLGEHHATCPPAEIQQLDWHVHFVMPWQPPGDDPVSPDGKPGKNLPKLMVCDRPANTSGAATQCDCEGLNPPALAAAFESAAGDPPRALLVNAASYFYENFAPTLSVPQRFCIARC